MPASRCISVSMSPSARASAAICPASQSVGSRFSRAIWPNTRAQRLVWVSSASLRKSGIWQHSHSSRTRARPCASFRVSGSRASAASVSMSDASLPFTRPGPGGGAARLSSSASTPEKSRSLLRQQSTSSGSNVWPSTAATASSGSGRHWAVVPKVPSRMPRPARPAIWAISAAVSRRGRWPSNLPRPAKATWSTAMFRPMPMASVATRKSTSLSWYSATWALRVRGDSRPITTAHPPRRRRICSAMA